MGIEDVFLWYQRKIGTYDKQQWETRLEQREQRILYGFKHVPTRSTKPNTDLIDLDLVRGSGLVVYDAVIFNLHKHFFVFDENPNKLTHKSCLGGVFYLLSYPHISRKPIYVSLAIIFGRSSFTKAKPQHGFLKVARLATLRFIFLPFYSSWWIKQTSRKVFIFILSLYIAQFINIIAYYFYTTNSTTELLSCMEIIVPLTMMWVLILIHSQIVATNPGTELKSKFVKSRPFRARRRFPANNSDRSVENERETSDNENFVRRKNKKLTFNDVVNVNGNDQISNRVRTKFLNIISPPKRTTNEDDGFESYNGNGSRTSDEDLPQRRQIPIEKPNPGFKPANSFLNKPECSKNAKKPSSSTDSDSEEDFIVNKPSIYKRRLPVIRVESSEDEMFSSPDLNNSSPLGEGMISTDWIGVTTNSEDYSSDIDVVSDDAQSNYDNDLAATTILNHSTGKVSCIIWERNEIKKADLTMLDISLAIISKVEAMPESMDYFYIGMVISTILAFLPVVCRFCNCNYENGNDVQFTKNVTMFLLLVDSQSTWAEIYKATLNELPDTLYDFFRIAFGVSFWEKTFIIITVFQRFILSGIVFFLLSVAERTFKQRLLYAKLFSHLTSSRRARKSELPHFRLNKVRNIKTWLSVRSYLKKRGPQRSVDVIVSTAFIISLLLLTFLCMELLKETVLFSQYYLEALIWCVGLGILLLRFMTLGTNINKKYRNLSVLITEQINLHLQIEQKPHKKDELTVANNVLKLAIDLLKELENPFKISGLSANPILYNVTKLVILSALSGVLSEMLGFKLKLHKIKLK